MTRKKVIIGVSGGPDSMFLLQKLFLNNNYELIVAHVNYNFRSASTNDQEIIKDFTAKNKIQFEVLEVNDDILKKYSFISNKQAIARMIRFDFFGELAVKYKTNIVYLAHHRDDFIETAIMQKERSNNYFYYGLQAKNNYQNLIIKRPLLTLYKNEIFQIVKEKNIPYVVDETNALPIYQRNKIRLDLDSKTKLEKNIIYNNFMKINKQNKWRNFKINDLYKKLSKQNFSYSFWSNIETKYQKQVLFKFLTDSNYFININDNKLEAIILFLKTKSINKKYRLMDNLFLVIDNDSIIIIN